jgi:Tfp pilus assembly protein PilO
MTKPTITTLTIATVYCLAFVLVLGYAYVTVRAQRSEAVSLRTTLAEQTSKQAAARTVRETIAATTDTRQTLSSFFLTESETISFIAEIESLAAAVGVAVETTALDISKQADSRPELKTGFAVEGSELGVKEFLRAVESLPYHSRLPQVRVSRDGNRWQAQVEVYITMSL